MVVLVTSSISLSIRSVLFSTFNLRLLEQERLFDDLPNVKNIAALVLFTMCRVL